MSGRIDRVDELLRQEIGAILARDVADPGLGFVTITGVETSPDLARARVRASVIGQAAERAATLAALRRAMPFVRHELGDRLHLRRIPELHVELDDSAERGTRVLRLLQELEAGRLPEEVPGPGESLPTPGPRPADEPAPRRRERGKRSGDEPVRGDGPGRGDGRARGRGNGPGRGNRSSRGNPPHRRERS